MLGSLDVLYSVLIHKLMAVYEEQEAQPQGATSPSPAGGGGGGGGGGGRPSPNLELYDPQLSVFQPIRGGEIEVNSSALKSNTPLLVRSSSESALSPETRPPEDITPTSPTLPPGVDSGLERTHTTDGPPSKPNQLTVSSLTRMVEISGELGPLGIHVVPYCSSLSGRALGLHIRGVEENSRSGREGIFQDEECIVQINDTQLLDKTFSQAQEVFRQAMRSSTVRLLVLPVPNRERYERSLIGQLFNQPEPSPRVPPPIKAKPNFKPSHPAALPLAEDGQEGTVIGSSVGLSPSPAPRTQSDSPLLKGPDPCMVANRKGGRRLRIDLKKGPEGLGFTVVTRDSAVHGPGPILVKNILPRGAAIRDGRLQSGDRILEVNGVDMIGRSQEELVAMLRSTRQGEGVVLLVSRQDDMFLPRQMVRPTH